MLMVTVALLYLLIFSTVSAVYAIVLLFVSGATGESDKLLVAHGCKVEAAFLLAVSGVVTFVLVLLFQS